VAGSVPSAAELAADVRAGRRSAVAVAEEHLARVGREAGALNAFRTVTAGRALEQAAAVDARVAAGEDPGPLAGVPIALKDNIAVAGEAWTASSPLREGIVAQEDAPIAAALAAAGAVLLGTLHMSEWAIGGTSQNGHYGPVRNPWDPEHVAGGSSGGSGAAVAADLALITLGTDTGGSVRIPAALCGVSGLRPTSGRVSNRGVIPCATTFDTAGPLARRVSDLAAALEVIAGFDPGDAISVDAPAGGYVAALEAEGPPLRVGVLRGWTEAIAEPAVAAAVALAAEVIAEEVGGGSAVVALDNPGNATIGPSGGQLLMAEAAAFHAERLRDRPDGFSPDVLTRLRGGQAVTGSGYAEGRQAIRVLRRAVDAALSRVDVLVVPAVPIPAPALATTDPLEGTSRLNPFTLPFSLTGHPALAVPCGFADGLPLSAQVVGRRMDEATVLRAGHAFQRVTDWHLRRRCG
jgi:aspartyl-tRNA(Asn)/glutamyl-tRNA(Gln) amidotransferase subunit A